MVTLYTTPLSANGRKVLAVSQHLGVAAEVKVINVYAGEGRSPAYLAINPWGKIPTLVDDELILWESNAILQYLAEAHGDYRLWSRTPQGRADIARWLYWEASAWQPTLTRLLTDVVSGLLFPNSDAPEPTVEWLDSRFTEQAGYLDAQLTTRRFLGGDELTIADFAVAGMMTYARAARFPFETYPQLGSWYQRIEALEAWRATAAGPWAP